MRVLRLFLCGLVLFVAGGVAVAEPREDDIFGDEGVNSCTINFDDSCPDTTPTCMTRVRGGSGCVVDGLPFCYDTGMFSLRVDAGDRAEFVIRQPVDQIEVFFAQAGAGAGGRMAFFDESGLQVGLSIGTNGVCADEMPATQVITFDRPVVRVRVRALDTDVYIDSLTLSRL